MIKTLYKYQDGQLLSVSGHLTDKEVQELKHEGYREQDPNVNKNGIRVVS